ncbi:MAG TPA: nucleotidyltransferase [Polyangiaceae bacterium]|nr:nucleotidyltransferase [Polyangiaceae bacterium]
MPRARSPFVAALADLSEALGALRIDWYLFGAQAALIHGAARVTADVDVTLRLGKVTPARLAAELRQYGFGLRIRDPSFVRTTRVLPVVHARTSVPVDLVLAGPGLEDAFLERAAVHDLGGVLVPVARAEDLIVMKILAGRDKDLDDVAAMLDARGAELDAKEVRSTLEMVESALGQSDLVPTWQRLRAGVARSVPKREPKAPKKSGGPRTRAKSSRARRRKRRASVKK